MENEKKIKVVLLEPGKLARATEIDASLAGISIRTFLLCRNHWMHLKPMPCA